MSTATKPGTQMATRDDKFRNIKGLLTRAQSQITSPTSCGQRFIKTTIEVFQLIHIIRQLTIACFKSS